MEGHSSGGRGACNREKALLLGGDLGDRGRRNWGGWTGAETGERMGCRRGRTERHITREQQQEFRNGTSIHAPPALREEQGKLTKARRQHRKRFQTLGTKRGALGIWGPGQDVAHSKPKQKGFVNTRDGGFGKTGEESFKPGQFRSGMGKAMGRRRGWLKGRNLESGKDGFLGYQIDVSGGRVSRQGGRRGQQNGA